LIIFEYSNQ